MLSRQALLQLLRDIRTRLDGDLSLQKLATRSGWSRFHLHRAFRQVTGETPKQYTLRLRLEQAAARLVDDNETVLRVAVAAGFTSHEVFTRAFRRRFGQTPAEYRAALHGASAQTRARHREVVGTAGPCIGLFHMSINHSSPRSTMPTLSMARQELAEQPVFFVRLRAARHELAAAIGEGIGKSYGHAQRAGLALAGPPFTRYVSTGPGLLSIEAGVPVAMAAPGEGEVEAGVLVGGPAAVALHAGSYEELAETYAAIERWIETSGFRAVGPPWEVYVTDPADHPDPAEWRTTVCWPLAE